MIGLDREAGKVYVNGEEVRLAPREYDVFESLMRKPGIPKHIECLLGEIWASSLKGVGDGVVYNTIYKLREKLPPGTIVTYQKRGYSICVETEPYWKVGC